MSTPLLNEADRQDLAKELTAWTVDAKQLERTFKFSDFREAFGFMAAVATAAEAMNHHPNWSNAYRTVHVTLTTHDAGGLTAKDAALAREMNRLAGG